MFTHMRWGQWRSFVRWFVEEDDCHLWHPAAGSAVAVDEEVHPGKQEPIQRLGESKAVEKSLPVDIYIPTKSEMLEI